MNDKKIRSLNQTFLKDYSGKKRPALGGILFPLFLLPLIVSCQSGTQQNTAILNLYPENAVIAKSNNQLSENLLIEKEPKDPTSEQQTKELALAKGSPAKNANNETSTAQSGKQAAKKTAKQIKPNNQSNLAYNPQDKREKLEVDLLANDDDGSLSLFDDSENPENLILNSTDEALSADNPNNVVLADATDTSGTFTSLNDSILLCDDSVYYEAWREQFDNSWLQANSKNYKTASSRNKALAQARTNEFIKLAYPSIEKTGFDFPVIINAQVLQWINYFKGAGRKNFVVWLRRSRSVIPGMQKILEQYGLPKDLVYLSMIESGYSPKALSYAGAVGPWQFMPATARENGLKINDYVDERRDYKKSTKAAANYLTQLYTQFGDWHLSAASYNVGPGRVQKTLRNYGSDSTFFELTSMGVVNRETADYVPKLIAAMIISKNPEGFGFDTTDAPLPPATKSIALTRSVSLNDLAKSLKIDRSVLDTLNPELRLGITPPPHATSGGKFELEVPASKYEIALASLDNLPNAPSKYMIAARIKRRETVAAFAARYRINTSTVLSANANLKANTRLNKGQLVYIPVSLGSGQYERLSASKHLNSKKMVKKVSIKSSHAVHGSTNKSKKAVALKHSTKNSKAFIKSKKNTRSSSVALKKKTSGSKKVATAGQRKKLQRSTN